MSIDEDDALKSVASAVVDALMSSEASRVIGALGLLPAPAAEAPLVPTKAGCVGIWQQVDGTEGAARFERVEEHAGEWHLWADTAVIPAKGTAKRIAYIGESTARGYFYDPAFTPAGVLQELLGLGEIAEGVEVVDLARSDLGFEGDLVRLASAAKALDPDAYVIFAGNNRKLPRSILRASPSRPAMLAAVLREHGVAGLRALTNAWREQVVEDVVVALGRLGVPVLVIIPEFNLGDWIHETSGDLPWLAGTGNQRWFVRLDRARQALESGDLAEAERNAVAMVELDEGLACSGLAILAQCARRQGRPAEARDHARRARDAHMGWDFGSPETPRLDEVTRSALRGGLPRAGVATLDCADVFERHLQGELADRRVFLDYCHLTSEGIAITMAAAAQRLIPMLGGRSVSQEALLRFAPSPAPDVEAQARLAAAIHNAHWGQPFEIVRHHCARAIELAPRLSRVFEDYLHMATCRTPNWMCGAMETVLRADCPALVKYVLGYGANSLLDRTLTDAMAETIEPDRPGASARLRALRMREYGLVEGVREDLLAAQYAPSFMDREWAHSGLSGAVESDPRPVVQLVAHSPRSRLVFICDARRPVVLEMVCRLVDVQSTDEPTRVLVNGAFLAEVALTRAWTADRLTVPPAILIDGINELEIQWPTCLEPGERALERVASKTERKLGSARFLPVYGSIHALTATLEEQGTPK